MTWRDVWYPKAVAAMIQIRGEGGLSVNGTRLPLTSAIDTLAIIAQFPATLAGSIQGFQQKAGQGFVFNLDELSDRALNTSHLNTDGTTRDGVVFLTQMGVSGIDSISIRDYLAGYPDVSAAWLRSPLSSDDFYGIWIPDGVGAETNILALYRSAVAAWQRAVNASTDMLNDYGADLLTSLADWRNKEFWSGISQLCIAMDVIGSTPMATNADKVIGGIKVALERSGEVAGQGAAHIAEAVGRTAGAAAEGFFDTAGLTAVAVAGVAVYLLAS